MDSARCEVTVQGGGLVTSGDVPVRGTFQNFGIFQKIKTGAGMSFSAGFYTSFWDIGTPGVEEALHLVVLNAQVDFSAEFTHISFRWLWLHR